MMENETYLSMGKYLALSSSLDGLIHNCFKIFIFDQEVMDSLQKESFDHKVKKLRHYLNLLILSGALNEAKIHGPKLELDWLQNKFRDIRKLRNFLAHAEVRGDHISSTRRYKGEDNGVMEMNLSQLNASLMELQQVIATAQVTFRDINLSLAKDLKKPAQSGPVLNNY